MHVHASALEFLIFAAYAVIFGFLWRAAQQTFGRSDNEFVQTVGKAMATIY